MKLKYHFSCTNPASQFIQIDLQISCAADQEITLQLPSWRPGRYQIADYAQNIRHFKITDFSQQSVNFEKTSKNTWCFSGQKDQSYSVSYQYYAAKMDAGSCWVDDSQMYLNFVNCCMEILGFPELRFTLTFDLPTGFSIATTLPTNSDNEFEAANFQELADSSFLASINLTHWEYTLNEVKFNCWFNGEIHFSKEQFLSNFSNFTRRQIEDFGEFPESEYHFIFQLLPYPHYHGVEHKKGTVITFGTAESLTEPIHMEELLGVSSHELYHAWNVCRIRPVEFSPYDFSRETYTKAGWIMEGITTYMGDLYLLKSKVYSLETYLKHLEKIINRENLNLGWRNYNILESSMDLWLDGYQAGIPDRKVNIYSHGALICLCLDLMLLKADNTSMCGVMKQAWEKFGVPNRGFSLTTFWDLVLKEGSNKEELDEFYSDFISGNKNLLVKVTELLPEIGLELIQEQNSEILAAKAGILTSDGKIVKIHPESPVYQSLMIGDELNVEILPNQLAIEAKRQNGRSIQLDLEIGEKDYFPELKLKIISSTPLRKLWMQ